MTCKHNHDEYLTSQICPECEAEQIEQAEKKRQENYRKQQEQAAAERRAKYRARLQEIVDAAQAAGRRAEIANDDRLIYDGVDVSWFVELSSKAARGYGGSHYRRTRYAPPETPTIIIGEYGGKTVYSKLKNGSYNWDRIFSSLDGSAIRARIRAKQEKTKRENSSSVAIFKQKNETPKYGWFGFDIEASSDPKLPIAIGARFKLNCDEEKAQRIVDFLKAEGIIKN